MRPGWIALPPGLRCQGVGSATGWVSVGARTAAEPSEALGPDRAKHGSKADHPARRIRTTVRYDPGRYEAVAEKDGAGPGVKPGGVVYDDCDPVVMLVRR